MNLIVLVCVLSRFSCVQLFETLWAIARQAPLSMGFSRLGYGNYQYVGYHVLLQGIFLTQESLMSLSVTGRKPILTPCWKLFL